MGMTGMFTAIRDETYARLTGQSSEEWSVYDGRAHAANDESLSFDLDAGAGDGMSVDVDKAWHGIHYCLTGSHYGEAPIIDFMLSSGDMSENILSDMGARHFPALQIKAIADHIGTMTRDDLYKNYKPRDMDEEVYPSGIWLEEGDEAFDYIYDYFKMLQTFVKECADKNCGFILVIG